MLSNMLEGLRARALAVCVGFLVPLSALAVPAFSVQDIGSGVPADVNSAGSILGSDNHAGTQPWVLVGGTKVLLPLPAGAAAASAGRIGETGAVVGQVGTQAAVWWPDGGGGYAPDLLAFPPGATVGRAVAVNAGETVLVSFGFPFKLVTGLTFWNYKPYLYTRRGDLVDLALQNPSLTSLAEAVGAPMASTEAATHCSWPTTSAPAASAGPTTCPARARTAWTTCCSAAAGASAA